MRPVCASLPSVFSCSPAFSGHSPPAHSDRRRFRASVSWRSGPQTYPPVNGPTCCGRPFSKDCATLAISTARTCALNTGVATSSTSGCSPGSRIGAAAGGRARHRWAGCPCRQAGDHDDPDRLRGLCRSPRRGTCHQSGAARRERHRPKPHGHGPRRQAPGASSTEVVPGLRRLAVLWNPGRPRFASQIQRFKPRRRAGGSRWTCWKCAVRRSSTTPSAPWATQASVELSSSTTLCSTRSAVCSPPWQRSVSSRRFMGIGTMRKSAACCPMARTCPRCSIGRRPSWIRS